MSWWWFAAALAGPNTVLVGVEDVEQAEGWLAPWASDAPRCWDAARLCWFDSADPDGAVAALAQQRGVRHVARDRPMDLVDTTAPQRTARASDALGTDDCADQWELDTIGAFDAWDIVTGEDAPVVAVADGGFLLSHEEIRSKISGQWDYGNGDSVAELEPDVGVPGHGTFIGALIAADSDNGVGRAGVVPDGWLNLLKIADYSGAFYWSYAVSALADIGEGDLGIQVVNYSIASSSDDASFRDAVRALADVDILMVAAAANCSVADCYDADNDAYPLYPANYTFDHVVTVAGSTTTDTLNSYSHYGSTSVDLAAPGVSLCSASVDSDDDYATASGTSYATPLVAGAAALVFEAHPELTARDVGRVLRASAAEVGGLDDVTQAGRLDLAAALVTGVPELSEPSTLTIDGTDSWSLALHNLAAAGEASVLVLHDGAFDITGASDDFEVTPFEAGDTVVLPDAGSWTASTAGSLLEGTLEAHDTALVELDVVGRRNGSHEASVRLSLASDGADYLNAPYDEGSLDGSGFLAWSFDVEVQDASVDTESPSDTDLPGDTDSPTDSDEPSDSDEPPPPGCDCASAASPAPAAGLLWVVLVGLVRRRPNG